MGKIHLYVPYNVVWLLFIGAQKAEENGEDYDRVKLLDKTADELERMEKKRKKKNPDEGFSGTYVLYLMGLLNL